MTLDLLEAGRLAGQKANEQVPEFKEIGDAHHERWLKAYDEAFTKFFLKGESK